MGLAIRATSRPRSFFESGRRHAAGFVGRPEDHPFGARDRAERDQIDVDVVEPDPLDLIRAGESPTIDELGFQGGETSPARKRHAKVHILGRSAEIEAVNMLEQELFGLCADDEERHAESVRDLLHAGQSLYGRLVNLP
jgi:hypothetical protein